MSHRAFIALGSNLQDPAAQVNSALREISRLPGTQLLRHSSLYRTAPVGYDNQPDFINAAAEVSTTLQPLALLRALLTLEASHGRERPFANAPRVLDLDLLIYDARVMHTPELTLPHPRLHERGFVLLPLAEIAPDLVIPGKGRVSVLASSCRDHEIEKMAAR
jgi:2-amino-4-hydroxy-6-hydroxymethyldihydropteridine diphosphokinase